MTFKQRVITCFKGLTIGDAVGKQTEMLSRAGVRKHYPDGIKRFFGEPGEVIPRYAGKRYEWRFGETTDDTEQTIAVARTLLQEGGVFLFLRERTRRRTRPAHERRGPITFTLPLIRSAGNRQLCTGALAPYASTERLGRRQAFSFSDSSDRNGSGSIATWGEF